MKSEQIYSSLSAQQSASLPNLALAREEPVDNRDLFQTQVVQNLYDIGRTPQGITPICNKCARDTFYCRHRVGNGEVTSRRPGTVPTSNSNYGSYEHKMYTSKPRYGMVDQRKHFYDTSHLAVGQYD